MFEIIINLILTGFFLQAQIKEQAVLSNVGGDQYNLPWPQVMGMQESAPQRDFNSDSMGVKITAPSALVIDEKSDKVLYSKNPIEVRPVASLTKLMTALVFLEYNPGWSKEVIINSDDYRPGAITYLIAGEHITTKDLFYAMLVSSSNEAAVALARSTGLSPEEFVNKMNEKAQNFGMVNSHFADPTGLSIDNKSTVKEMTILFKIALDNQHLSRTISSADYSLTILNKDINRRVKSTNWILGQPFGYNNDIYQSQAGKTGHLMEAGYCFITKITNQNNKSIIVVVLGSDTIEDRFADAKSLAYWVFKNYQWP